MPPKLQLDKEAWKWADTTQPGNVTDENVATAYRIPVKPCLQGACKRNCKGNPFCLNGLGEKQWLGELDLRKYTDFDPEVERREKNSYVGLKNLGATCYVNTFLQLWFHNSAVRQAIFKWRDSDSTEVVDENWTPSSICGQLQLIFSLLRYSEKRFIDPTWFINHLGLDTGLQQDAQEFCKLFLNLLESSMCQSDELNIIQEQFRGQYFYVIKCKNCGAESKTSSMFYELDLNIQGQKTLHQALDTFLQEEVLEGENRYMCRYCQEKQDATRAIRLDTIPPVLNLQLLRFIFDKKTGHKKKLNSFLQFPDTLDMSKYIHTDKPVIYQLKAVLIHSGPSAYSGHYTAHILSDDKTAWYRFNDENIHKMMGKKLQLGTEDESDLLGKEHKIPKTSKGFHSSKNAYMLVYSRQDSELKEKLVNYENEYNLLPSTVQDYVQKDNDKFNSWISEILNSRDSNIENGKAKQSEIQTIYKSLLIDDGTQQIEKLKKQKKYETLKCFKDDLQWAFDFRGDSAEVKHRKTEDATEKRQELVKIGTVEREMDVDRVEIPDEDKTVEVEHRKTEDKTEKRQEIVKIGTVEREMDVDRVEIPDEDKTVEVEHRKTEDETEKRQEIVKIGTVEREMDVDRVEIPDEDKTVEVEHRKTEDETEKRQEIVKIGTVEREMDVDRVEIPDEDKTVEVEHRKTEDETEKRQEIVKIGTVEREIVVDRVEIPDEDKTVEVEHRKTEDKTEKRQEIVKIGTVEREIVVDNVEIPDEDKTVEVEHRKTEDETEKRQEIVKIGTVEREMDVDNVEIPDEDKTVEVEHRKTEDETEKRQEIVKIGTVEREIVVDRVEIPDEDKTVEVEHRKTEDKTEKRQEIVKIGTVEREMDVDRVEIPDEDKTVEVEHRKTEDKTEKRQEIVKIGTVEREIVVDNVEIPDEDKTVEVEHRKTEDETEKRQEIVKIGTVEREMDVDNVEIPDEDKTVEVEHRKTEDETEKRQEIVKIGTVEREIVVDRVEIPDEDKTVEVEHRKTEDETEKRQEIVKIGTVEREIVVDNVEIPDEDKTVEVEHRKTEDETEKRQEIVKIGTVEREMDVDRVEIPDEDKTVEVEHRKTEDETEKRQEIVKIGTVEREMDVDRVEIPDEDKTVEVEHRKTEDETEKRQEIVKIGTVEREMDVDRVEIPDEDKTVEVEHRKTEDETEKRQEIVKIGTVEREMDVDRVEIPDEDKTVEVEHRKTEDETEKRQEIVKIGTVEREMDVDRVEIDKNYSQVQPEKKEKKDGSNDFSDELFEELEDIMEIEEIISASESEDEDVENLHLSNMLSRWNQMEEIQPTERVDTTEQTQTTSIDYIDSNDDDDNEEVLIDYSKENDLMRDKNNPDIYIAKVMKSDYKNTKQRKTGNRVYNSLHCCFFCKKLILHIRPHLRAKHSHIKKVSDAFKDKSGKELNKLRAMGDDMNNRNVITEKKGQLLLMRRPLKQFTATDYGPCPNCLEWISKNNIKRHQSRCISLENSFGVQTRRNLLLQSDVASGRFVSSASKLLKDEVFSSMTVDDITEVAKSDVLIVALGEYWLRQNIDNPLKRANYSSQRMRLAARLLIELQKQTSEECSMTMWDFLQPSYFDSIVNAALETALPSFDDEEELKSPSNCLKLKYDILRLVNFKWSFLIKANSSNEEKKKCKNFLQLMSLEFKTKVTKLAYTVLIKRSFTKTKEIPTPSDIELLNKHIHTQLSTSLLNPVKENFRKVLILLQCRLLCYNKRRSGEIDAISLRSYSSRRKDLSDVDQSLIGDLTSLEKHLLESQDLMIVRGKRCKPVPVIIPNDCKKPLEYIADKDVREKVGIFNENKYLFPNSVNGATRSYESLKTVCSELNLKHPENITSVSMRKYTATLSQVIDLNSNQLEWLCKHLGHTKRVHKEHYQQMSGFIERVKVSKLLLVQDMNLTSKFAGKKLDEITFEDVLSSSKETDETDERPPITITNTPSFSQLLDDDSDSGYEPKDKKRKPNLKRVRWTSEQVKELYKFFKEHLDKKTTPRKSEILKVLKQSSLLNVKSYTDIIKKISNINHKI